MKPSQTFFMFKGYTLLNHQGTIMVSRGRKLLGMITLQDVMNNWPPPAQIPVDVAQECYRILRSLMIDGFR